MSLIHKRAIAVTLAVASLALSAYAQRGGGAMGRGGGFASHSSPTFRGNSAPAGQIGSMAPHQFGTSRNSSPNSNQRFFGRQGPTGYSGRSYGDGRNERDDRYRRYYRPYYGVGLPYGAGWFGPEYLGYPGIGFEDDSAYGYGADQPPPDSQTAQYGEPPDAQAAQYGPPPVDQSAPPPTSAYRPAYQREQPKYDPAPEVAVTLVFKDGRPTEEIRNYMITRTTLYVQGQHLREIPVDQIDLAATEKVNRDTGADFQIPANTR